MILALDLPQELSDELSAEAAQLGLSLNEYALRVLSSGRVAGEMPKTGAELVSYWQSAGLIGMRPEIADSQEHARMLRGQAEARG
jgi:hypothetical protein